MWVNYVLNRLNSILYFSPSNILSLLIMLTQHNLFPMFKNIDIPELITGQRLTKNMRKCVFNLIYI